MDEIVEKKKRGRKAGQCYPNGYAKRKLKTELDLIKVKKMDE